MSRFIIVQTRDQFSGYFQFNVVFWLTVPLAKQPSLALINKNATSAVLDASTDELAAIHSGLVYEIAQSYSYSQNTPIVDVGTDLVAKYTQAQADLSATLTYSYYGTYYDGSGFVIQGG